MRRLGAWLWSSGEPQFAYSCPKDGDWRLELRDLCMVFPEVRLGCVCGNVHTPSTRHTPNSTRCLAGFTDTWCVLWRLVEL